MYSEYELDFGSVVAGHVVSAASRICESRLIWDMLAGDRAAEIKSRYKSYDDFICDIGGNFVTNIKLGRVDYVHSCEPQLTIYDSYRRSNRFLELMRTEPDRLPVNSRELLMIKDVNKVRCENKFENCTRTSMFGMAIHSVYDIHIQDFINGMDKKEMLLAYASVLFDPRMLHQNSGTLEGFAMDWIINEKTGKIKFTFNMESSFSYEHNFKNFLMYFTNSHMISQINGRHYVIERLVNRGPIHIIKFTYIDNTATTDTPLCHDIPFSYNQQCIAITYYKWSYLNRDRKADATRICGYLAPYNLIVRREEYDDSLSFAIRLDNSKFTPSAVYEYLVSYRYKKIKDQKNILSGDVGDAAELFCVAQAIYLMAYKIKYEQGKVVRHLLDEQAYLRKYANMSYFGHVWDRIASYFSTMYDKFRKKNFIPPIIQQIIINKLEVSASFHDFKSNKGSSLHFLDLSWGMPECEGMNIMDRLSLTNGNIQKYTLSDDSNEVIESTDYVCPRLEGGSSDFMTQDVFPEFENPRNLCGSIQSCPFLGNMRKHSTDVVRNDGNGNCLYYSLLGCSNVHQVENFKKVLLSRDLSIYQRDVRSRMVSDLTTPFKDAVETIIHLYTSTNDCLVYLHGMVMNANGRQECFARVYGNPDSQNIIHIRHRDNHFERIGVCTPSTDYLVHKPLDRQKSESTETLVPEIELPSFDSLRESKEEVVPTFKQEEVVALAEPVLDTGSVDDPIIDASPIFAEKRSWNLPSCDGIKRFFKSDYKKYFLFMQNLDIMRVKPGSHFVVDDWDTIPRMPSNVVLRNADFNLQSLDKFRFHPQLCYTFAKIQADDILLIDIYSRKTKLPGNHTRRVNYTDIRNFDMNSVDVYQRYSTRFSNSVTVINSYPLYFDFGGKRVSLICNNRIFNASYFRNLLSSRFGKERTKDGNPYDRVYMYDPYRRMPMSEMSNISHMYNYKRSKNSQCLVSSTTSFRMMQGKNIIIHLHSSVSHITNRIFSDLLAIDVESVLFVCYERKHYDGVGSHLLKTITFDNPCNSITFNFNPEIVLKFEDFTRGLSDFSFKEKKIAYYKYKGIDCEKSPSKAADKLTSILRQLIDVHPRSIIDLCANPGGFSKVLRVAFPGATLMIHSFYNSTTCPQLDPIFDSDAKVIVIRERMHEGYHGDLLKPDQLDYLLTQLVNSDMITADGCVGDGPAHPDNLILLRNQLLIAKEKLNPGGLFIVKIFLNEESARIVYEFSSYFIRSDIVKPATSNPISSEYYCVFYGFTGTLQSPTFTYTALYDAYNTYTSHLLEFMKYSPIVNEESSVDKPSEIIEAEVVKPQQPPCNRMFMSTSTIACFDEFMKMKSEVNLNKLLLAMEVEGFDSDYLDSLNIDTDFSCFDGRRIIVKPIDKDTIHEICGGKTYLLKSLSTIVDSRENSPSLKDRDLIASWRLAKNRFNPFFELGNSSDVIRRNAIREIREVNRMTPIILSEVLHIKYHQEFFCASDLSIPGYKRSIISNSQGNYGVYDTRLNKWAVSPLGELKYQKWFNGDALVDFGQSGTHRYCLVNDDCEYVHEIKLYESLLNIPIYYDFSRVKFHFIQGVPGCGKTTYILKNVKSGDLILTSTREGRKDVEDRLKTPNVLVKTVHSFLINSSSSASVVWVDEFLMRHYGEILAVAIASRCSIIKLIGDKAQIPYFNRCPSFLLSFYNSTEYVEVSQTLNISYRCPVDVAYLFRSSYDGKFSSASKVVRSMSCKLINNISEIDTSGNVKFLVFKKADRQTLLENGFKNVNTIGETQGLEFENVALVRLSKIEVEEIFLKAEQQLVGCTRHRKNFCYYSVVRDPLFKRIESLPGETECLRVAGIKLYGGRRKPTEVIEGDLRRVPHRYFEDIKFSNHYDDVKVALPTYNFPHNHHRILLDTVYYNDGFLLTKQQPKVIYKVTRNPFSYAPLGPGLGRVYLQDCYDRLLPGNSTFEYKFDQDKAESTGLNFPYRGVRVDLSKNHPLPPHKPSLTPMLRTSMPWDRRESQFDSLIGLMKRNLGVPQMMGLIDEKFFVEQCVEGFIKTYIDPKRMNIFSGFEFDHLNPDVNSLVEWLSDQENKNLGHIKEKFSLTDRLNRFDVYDLMNKPQVKPGLTVQTPYEYAAVQTIASQSKEFNMFWCPIFRNCKRRLRSVMNKRFFIYADMAPDDFTRVITTYLPPEVLAYYKALEVDIGKYDKSQHRLLFEIECELYRRLGVPPRLIAYWRLAHEKTILKDRRNGVKAHVTYQRKSGDASTFFGNTLLLMVVLATLFDLSDAYGLFSGDDSVLWLKDIIDRNELCGLLFNLESKFFKYNYHYFCSKFLLNVRGYWMLVPDPLKILTKLGRHNIADWDHLEEYRISLNDLLGIYKRGDIYDELNEAFAERYHCTFDIKSLCATIIDVISTPENFKSLFYVEEGVTLISDPSRRKLD
uniref:Replicase large subunit n=1 Tax=Atrato Virga-like virus 5 TaxID=2689344 RepID=A0A6B9KG45_9VIRU|nr:polyprotein [Atrato Virga-like virus 5]